MIVAIYQNATKHRTYLHHEVDAFGNETWCAFVGSRGGDMRVWKSLQAAEKALNARGWEKISERKAKEA